MAKIVLSDASQFSITGALKVKVKHNKEYLDLVKSANKRIDEDRRYYALAYKRASSCLAR